MSLVFWLKESFAGFFREKGSAFISFFVNTFFFLIFAIFLLVTYNLYTFTQKVKQKMEIDVYVAEGLTDKENEELRSKIIKIEGVEGAIFRTKEKALQELKNYLGKDILEGLESNPLPSSWVVKLKPAYPDSKAQRGGGDRLRKVLGRKNRSTFRNLPLGKFSFRDSDNFGLFVFDDPYLKNCPPV
jgi:cell division protein FtsX